MVRKKNTTSWMKFFISIFFFVIIPVLLSAIGWKFIIVNRISRFEHESISNIQHRLETLKRESDNNKYIQRKLDYFYGMISEQSLTQNSIEKQLDVLRQNNLSFLKINFFDAKQQRIFLKTEPKKYRSLLNHMFQALIQPEVGNKSTLLAKYKPFFTGFFGVNVDPSEVVYDKSNFRKARISGRNGYFYWNSFYANGGDGRFKGGFIAYCYEDEIPETLAMSALIQTANSTSGKNTKYGLLNLDETLKKGETGYELQKAMIDVVEEARSGYVSKTHFRGNLFMFLEISPRKLIYALKHSEHKNYRDISFVFQILAMIITIGLIRIFFNAYITGDNKFIPIGQKLVFLFLYATMIPLIAFIIVGYQHVISKEKLLSQDKYDELSSYIRNVDNSYTRAVYKLENEYQKLLKKETFRGMNRAGISKLVKDWKQKKRIIDLMIVDSKGRIRFSTNNSKRNKGALIRLVPTLARKLFMIKKGQSASLKNKMKDMMVESFTENFSELLTGSDGNSGFFKNFERMSRINELWLANKRYYCFNAFMKTFSGETLMVFVWNDAKKFSERYLSDLIKKNVIKEYKGSGIKLATVPTRKNSRPYPPGFTKYPFTSSMSERVIDAGIEQREVADMGGEDWMVVASPLKQIPTFVLFAMYPSALINYAIFVYGIKMFLVSFISIVFALFVGNMLSQQFLIPVKELGSGIKELKARNFSYRVPKLANDELGRLSEAFNSMIINVDEMAGATLVQNLLLPHSYMDWPGFEVYGKSESLGDIGGDYFDYFNLKDDYSVFLIGDVAGYGVRSALIMAIAKTIVSVMSEDILIHPSEALKYMNAVIIKTLRRRLLMTFFLGVINHKTGNVKIANAGHCFPVICRIATREAKFIELPAYPLGGRTKTVYPEKEIRLENGDSLVLYTDGWPSSIKNNGEILSFEGFFNIIENNIFASGDLSKIYKKTNEEYLKETDRSKDADDRTLIILRKHANKEDLDTTS